MSKISEKKKEEGQPAPFTPEWRETVPELMNSEAWQSFVLGLLKPDELIEGYPSTPGLLRISRLIFGHINISTTVFKAPTSEDRSATMQAIISVPTTSMYTYASADVYEHNCDAPFNKHPVASAETKAIGRALKFLLNIKVHTHEEMMGGDDSSYDKINERQIKTVLLLCERLSVDVEKFLAANAGVSKNDFTSGNVPLTKDQGVALLEALNIFQNKGVPQEFTIAPLDTAS